MDDGKRPDQQNSLVGSPAPEGPILHFGEFQIDRSARVLAKGDTRILIQQKPLDVLIYLAENGSRLVTREELLEKFWPRAVNEEALTRCISTIRKCLADIRDPPRYVETLWGQGYRFIEHISSLPSDVQLPSRGTGTEQAPSEVRRPGYRFARLSVKSSKTLLFLLAIAVLLVLIGWVAIFRNSLETAINEINRIAVLPIESPRDEDWTASAMTDQLIRTISRIEGVTVVAKGSAAKFSAASDPIEVGAQLRVDAVLISELDRSEGGTRLRSELVSTRNASVLWSFHSESAQALTEEEQIIGLSGAVARRLWASLQLRDAEIHIDPVAYRHYLRGRYYWSQRSGPSLEAAIDSFNAALELEPNYIDALTGLAESWLLMPLYGAMAPIEAIPRARAAAEHALRLNPDQARAHAVIGVIKMQFDWDWADAESHLRKAVTLNPNDSTAVQWLGELYCYQARIDECRRNYQIASGLDPLSPVLQMMQGSPDLYSGNFLSAVAAYQGTLTENPDFTFTYLPLGYSYAGLQAWDEAIASYQSSLPELGLAIVGGPLIYSLARKGEMQRARELLSELEELAQTRYVPPTKLAIAYLGLGEKRQALDLLWQAINMHDDRLVYLAVDSLFSDLYTDPEFHEIARRTGLLDVLTQASSKTPVKGSSGFDVD